MISYEGQSLSTRKGNIVYLEDLLDQAQEKALKIIEEKSPNLENKAEVARQVGIGAVVYADLSNNRIKDIDFSAGLFAEVGTFPGRHQGSRGQVRALDDYPRRDRSGAGLQQILL